MELAEIRLSSRSFDRLRSAITTGLEVRALRDVVVRGEDVEVEVTIGRARGLGDVEVGLLCTEVYAEEAVREPDREGSTSEYRYERTVEDTAYAAWQPVEDAVGTHRVRLTVPADAPFSYRGTVLSYRWQVVARGVRRLLPDAWAACDLEVRP